MFSPWGVFLNATCHSHARVRTHMLWNVISSYLISADCIKGNGRFYQGSMNKTKDGLTCQRWFTSDPHPQPTPEGVFPEMRNAGNNCRNPGGSEPEPWCYTTDPGVRWQFCSIRPCSKILYCLHIIGLISPRTAGPNQGIKLTLTLSFGFRTCISCPTQKYLKALKNKVVLYFPPEHTHWAKKHKPVKKKVFHLQTTPHLLSWGGHLIATRATIATT